MRTRRRRSYVQRRLQLELLRWARVNRRLILKSLAAAAAVCAVPLLIGSPPYVTGFAHAFMITALLAILTLGFLFARDGALLLAGPYGEQYTRDAVEEAVKHGHVWSAVHNIEAGTPDVNHLVLAPARVLALETKWRFRGAGDAWLAGAVAQAREAARKGRLVLLSRTVAQRLDVRPVVVWGGGQAELPDAQVVDEVDVVRGDALAAWLTKFGRGPLAEDNAAALHARAAAFAESRVPHL